MTILLLSFRTAGDFCIHVDTCETLKSSKDLLISFLTSSGVFSKKHTKSFVRYSVSEKYCEYAVHQVGLCLSHLPSGGGRGGVGSVTEQS